MKIYIDPLAHKEGQKQGAITLPADCGVVEWTDVCHGKQTFIWIRHSPYRDTSRWTHVERKRPFIVTIKHPKSTGTHELSAHKTLEAAIKSAVQYASENAPKSIDKADMVKTEIRNYVISTYLETLAPVSVAELNKKYNVSGAFIVEALNWSEFDYEGVAEETVIYPSRILLANLLKKARAK